MGDEDHERLSALCATMGWRGAQENICPKCVPDGYKLNGTSQAYLLHIKRGNKRNIVKIIPKNTKCILKLSRVIRHSIYRLQQYNKI